MRIKLGMVNLDGFEDFMISELSGGMKKRAALARAVALDPRILFFDEPSAGLDPITSAELDELIVQLNRSLGTTIVVVSHELPSIFTIADRGASCSTATTKAIIADGAAARAARAASRSARACVLQPTARPTHPQHRRTSRVATEARKFRVGVFVIVAILIGLAAAIWLGASRYLADESAAVTYFSESVQGLDRGAAVKYRGVPAGRVESIGIAPDGELIEVVMSIDTRYADVLFKDPTLRAQLQLSRHHRPALRRDRPAHRRRAGEVADALVRAAVRR